jgi:Tfp pilus assembly major pilin PilA
VRQRPRQDGFTVYQLLVSIVVIAIIGALWGAYNQNQQIEQQQRKDLSESKNG